MLGDPITELTIAMEVNYFQLNRAEYFIPIMVKIPGSELALARKAAPSTRSSISSAKSRTTTAPRSRTCATKADIKLSDTTAAELAKRPIEYDTGYTLLPGKYTDQVSRPRQPKPATSALTWATFVIPNLHKEEKRMPISSVVLSSQRAT